MKNRTLIGLIALIFILAVASAGAIQLLHPSGSRVVVTVDGKEYGTYNPDKDQIVRIGAEDGSWYNLLEIRSGTAFILESDCKNQVCVNTPPLEAETPGIIVCLPHGVVVELK